MLSSALLIAINHILAGEAWARDKLMPHVGKVACLDNGLVSLKCKVAPDGLLEAVAGDEFVNVAIKFAWSDMPLMLQNRERAFSYVKLEGDADFAHAISQLSHSLRWEAEHDLAQWVGEIAAVRMASHAKAAWHAGCAKQEKWMENIAEYLLEENPMLVQLQSLNDFASEAVKMRDDMERLIKRIEKLEGRR